MPIYEYICEACGIEEEVVQSINEPAPICSCQNLPMKKQLSAFKTRRGGGLYSIDTPSPRKMGMLKED